MDKTPKNDATPTAIGASVTKQINFPHSTFANLGLIPPSHHNAPKGTSHVAAHRIAGYAKTLQTQVWGMLRDRGALGATDQEMQEALNLPSNTQIPRRWELVKAGAVVPSGFKRKTRSNCPAMVWVLSEFAAKQEGGAA